MDNGKPTSVAGEFNGVVPLWSNEEDARAAISDHPGFASCTVIAVDIAELRRLWLPELDLEGELVGLNWSGETLAGHDIKPSVLERQYLIQSRALQGAPISVRRRT